MSTHNLCFEQKYENYQNFLSENFHFLVVKFSVCLNRHVFIMIRQFNGRSQNFASSKVFRLYRKITINGHFSLWSSFFYIIYTFLFGYKYKQKCIDYIEKWPFLVIFLYNLYIFVWLQHGCLADIVLVLDPSSSVIKWLWCNYSCMEIF